MSNAKSALSLFGLLAVAALLGSSCNGDMEDRGGESPLTQPEQFALIIQVENERIVFDPAEFLSGETALLAAREDGHIGQFETLPNDYYIRNTSNETWSLPVAEGFQATLLDAQTLQPAAPIDLQQLQQLFAGETSADAYYGFVPDHFPMHLTLQGDSILVASQVYLP